MKSVTLDIFYKSDDFELSQYQILNCIKKYSSDLRQLKLFPGFEELSELTLQFQNINSEEICSNRITDHEFSSNSFIKNTEEESEDEENIDKILALIEWSKPLIQELVDEGNIIYDFVEHNINITELSRTIERTNSGYLLIPDNKKSVLHLIKYAITKTNEPLSKKVLQTRLIKSFPKELATPSSTLFLQNIDGESVDLNQENVFYCNTELDFPFFETLLPVAKTKLLAMLLE